MSEETAICKFCRVSPCKSLSIGQKCARKGYACHARTGKVNRGARFYLDSMRIKEVHGYLCRSARIKIPDCMEKIINVTFPTKDGDDFVVVVRGEPNA